jgi:uncharacterized glyoxalase superfamily protein PhnB
MQKKSKGVCLITADVRRLSGFYQDVLETTAEGDESFVTFAALGAELSIFPEQGMEVMAPGSIQGAGRGSLTLEFEAEDVEQGYEHLKALNVQVVKPPTTQPWGLRSV